MRPVLRVICNGLHVNRQFMVAFTAGPVMVGGPYKTRRAARRAAHQLGHQRGWKVEPDRCQMRK